MSTKYPTAEDQMCTVNSAQKCCCTTTWHVSHMVIVCLPKITCERWQRSGPIRPTLKTVHFTNPFSSASPWDILHVGKLDEVVQCFSLTVQLTPTRDSTSEPGYRCLKVGVRPNTETYLALAPSSKEKEIWILRKHVRPRSIVLSG